MSRRYQKLFEPTQIGSVEIKNRVAMAPMCPMGLTNPDGTYSRRIVDYLIERARGGVGLIVTGTHKVENEIEVAPLGIFPFISRAGFATYVELAEGVHAHGAKIFFQLTAGDGRCADPRFTKPVAPSAVPNYWDPTVTCRALTTEEVEQFVKRFGDAAEIAAEAGIDGVEIHAVHEEYLIDQFTMASFNKRTDKYGGDLQGRLTFPIEILQEIKRRVGKDFPVQLRFSVKSFIKDWHQGAVPGEEFKEMGRDLPEGLEMAKLFEEAGYDAFDADCGSYASWYWAHPPVYFEHGCLLPYVSELKKVVKIPVLAAGRMEIPDLAEDALAQGKADMVSIGRGLLTDPYWVRKVEEDKTKHIRPCIGCHAGCMGRLFLDSPLSCAVNPAVGRETMYRLDRAIEPKKVMVVGGGAAGLEAARVASLRGHQVTLYEKAKNLGGHLIEASVPGFKKDLERLLNWYKVELEDLKTDIKMGKDVTPDLVKKEKPDVTIIATGSEPLALDIPGVRKNHVTTDIELLLGKKKPGKTVAVVGGGHTGCETALWLAQEGKKVTLIEQLPELMTPGKITVPHGNKIMLLDLLAFHKVEVMTNSNVLEITDAGVSIVTRDFARKQVKADTVCLSVGLTPTRKLYDGLVGKIPYLYLIGDAREVRNIMGSVWDAYEVARGI